LQLSSHCHESATFSDPSKAAFHNCDRRHCTSIDEKKLAWRQSCVIEALPTRVGNGDDAATKAREIEYVMANSVVVDMEDGGIRNGAAEYCNMCDEADARSRSPKEVRGVKKVLPTRRLPPHLTLASGGSEKHF
jgi:hypothetical protein